MSENRCVIEKRRDTKRQKTDADVARISEAHPGGAQALPGYGLRPHPGYVVGSKNSFAALLNELERNLWIVNIFTA